ncbi:hypothetical protein EJB05_50132, partial [Eragrostis curvula]
DLAVRSRSCPCAEPRSPSILPDPSSPSSSPHPHPTKSLRRLPHREPRRPSPALCSTAPTMPQASCLISSPHVSSFYPKQANRPPASGPNRCCRDMLRRQRNSPFVRCTVHRRP